MTKIYDLATKIYSIVASWLPNEKVNFEPWRGLLVWKSLIKQSCSRKFSLKCNNLFQLFVFVSSEFCCFFFLIIHWSRQLKVDHIWKGQTRTCSRVCICKSSQMREKKSKKCRLSWLYTCAVDWNLAIYWMVGLHNVDLFILSWEPYS